IHAALSANTFAIYGTGHIKELTELVPGILNQLSSRLSSHPNPINQTCALLQSNQSEKVTIKGVIRGR
ncbi:hypothetical protein K438DRAFT_1586175, partial [Mycena galopus ATCC 62051]